MIVTSIGTDVYSFYGFDKKIITKNVFDPITEKYTVEYVQYYYYNNVGKLEPTRSTGINLDTYA